MNMNSDNKLIYHYLFEIGDFTWICEIPFPVIIKWENEEFFKPCIEDSDFKNKENTNKVIFSATDCLAPIPENRFMVADRYFVLKDDEKIMYKALIPGGDPYVEVHFYADGNILCKYVPIAHRELKYSNSIIRILSMEYLFLSNHGFILHSCLVKYEDNAILFSAPSGTGKSTQGDLWTEHRGAEVINGDRAGVFWDGNSWIASGLPYAGSSMIYRNETVPIKAIVYLAQGKENIINRLTAVQAFPLLYPQITIHHWEADFVNQISDILLQLMEDIPVYYLSCRPDVGAIEVLEKVLLNI